MPNFVDAKFELFSLDHKRVLLSEDVHSTRELLGEERVKPPADVKLMIDVNGKKMETLLKRTNGVFREGATMVLAGDNGQSERVPVPATYSYRSEDRKWALSFNNHEKFEGLFVSEQGLMYFVGENGKMRLDENAVDYLQGQLRPVQSMDTNLRNLEEVEEVDDSDVPSTKTIVYWDDCHSAQASGLSGVNIGGAVGYMMYKAYGEAGSLDLIESYIHLSNTIYEVQMDISLVIDDIFIATTSSAASWTASSCSISISTQLERMRSWSEPSAQPLWHLFDDCFGASGTTLGIAYIGTLCSSSANVGVSYISKNINLDDYPTWATVAHELGHNFNAQHSFEEGQGKTGGIMDYGPFDKKLIDGSMQFNTKYRKTEVCQKVQAAVRAGCVDIGSQGEVVSVAPEDAGDTGCNRFFGCAADKRAARDLQCVKQTHALLPVDNHGYIHESRDGFTLAQCKSACAVEEDCATFTYGVDGFCGLYTAKEFEDLVFNGNYDTYFCAEGKAPGGKLATKTMDNLLENFSDINKLEESCCVLEEDTVYLGINNFFREGYTFAKCQRECVGNSHCEALSYDIASRSCMLFGGVDFLNAKDSAADVFSFACDRSCINNEVVASESDNSMQKTIIGAVFGTMLVVAAIAGAVFFKHSANKARNVKANSTASANVSAQPAAAAEPANKVVAAKKDKEARLTHYEL